MAYQKNSSNTNMGDKYENLICDWIYSIGYYPKLYKMPNGSAQIKYLSKRIEPYIYPDIEVFVDENHANLKFLIESKSLSDYSLSRQNWFKKNVLKEYVDPIFNGVAIHTKNFNDYHALHLDYGFDVRIVFEIDSTQERFWQKVRLLNETKENVGDMFRDGENCYFWYLKHLRTDFKR